MHVDVSEPIRNSTLGSLHYLVCCSELSLRFHKRRMNHTAHVGNTEWHGGCGRHFTGVSRRKMVLPIALFGVFELYAESPYCIFAHKAPVLRSICARILLRGSRSRGRLHALDCCSCPCYCRQFLNSPQFDPHSHYQNHGSNYPKHRAFL